MESRLFQWCFAAMTAAMLSTVYGYLPTYYMDDWCSTTLDLEVQGIEAGRLLLRPPGRGLRYLNCFVFLRAPPGKRLSFRFRAFHVASAFDCDMNHLKLFEDRSLRLELTGGLCNGGLTPQGVYTSTGRDGAVSLLKKTYLEDQIELIFTSFHLAPCGGDEFYCANSHCISSSLRCNDYDNCGDGSDICLLNDAAIAGVIALAVVVIVILAVVIAVLLYRRQQRRRLEKLHMRQWIVVQDGKGRPYVLREEQLHHVGPLHKKRYVSDSFSTISSRMSKIQENPGVSPGPLHHEKHVLYQKQGDPGISTNPAHYEGILSKNEENPGFRQNPVTAEEDALFKNQGNPGLILSPDHHEEDVFPKKISRSSKKRENGKDSSKIQFNPLKSSSQKKDSSVKDGHVQVYAVPMKRSASSSRYPSDWENAQHSYGSAGASPSSVLRPEMGETNLGFKGRMKSEEESQLSLQTLDPSALPGASSHSIPHDHTMSFRSYSSPEPRRKERVVYLHPGHPRYHRLHEHSHEDETLKSDHPSFHSSHSSLVKL